MDEKSYIDLLTKKEDLHPDLRASITTRHGTIMLHHPLVINVFYTPEQNAFINKQYEYKVKAVTQAKQNKDWSFYILLHERPYRLEALLAILPYLNKEQTDKLVKDVWVDSESPHANIKVWRNLWSLTEDAGKKSKAFKDLPDLVTIYRGIKRLENKRNYGISWTLSEKTAEFFARRFMPPLSYILKAKVNKSNITALIEDRGETEVIVIKSIKQVEVKKLV